MPATQDIVATWTRPRRVYRRLLAGPAEEGRVLAWLMAGLLLLFVARLPELSRQAYLSDGELPFAGLALATGLGTLIFAPLLFFALAALGQLAARAFGPPVTGWQARVALFWGLLAVSPAMLLRGLVAAFIGPGPALAGVSALTGVAFVLFWVAGLWEAGARARAAV